MKVNIIPYCNEHHAIFKQLNVEWLEHYNIMEDYDLAILDDPEGMVLNAGGFIWMAEADRIIVGSAGLVKEHEGIYELAKMAVTVAYRGRGISKLLMEKCLEKVKELGATKLTLYSNHQLRAAISLYEKYGFRHVAIFDSPFETADVRMELFL